MYHLRRATIVALILATIVLITTFVPKALNPTPPSPEQALRDKTWVDSSPYWLDRQACRWISVCGIHHMRWDDPVVPRGKSFMSDGPLDLKRRTLEDGTSQERGASWEDAPSRPSEERLRTTRGEKLRDIPDYVLKHAPLVHMYSGENFWPSDIAEHVRHMTPFVNGAPVNMSDPVLSLANMYPLTSEPGMVFLTSKDDVEGRPEWLHSHVGVPEHFNDDGASISPSDGSREGEDEIPRHEDTTWFDVDKDTPLQRISDPRDHYPKRETLSPRAKRRQLSHLSDDPSQKPFPPPPDTPGNKPNASGYSASPAILVMVDKGSGILDAFWFFFYSYNLGQTVLNMRFGNHIGDWEHCMVRFENGVPRAMFLSEHEGGQAYAWGALEKKLVHNSTYFPGEVVERPVIFSAVGSHAMYAFPGPHAYVLPFKMLKDDTDRGPMWDPSLNKYAYFYDYTATPPEDDEKEKALDSDESTPYPFNITSLEARAKRNLGRRDDVQEPTSLTPASSSPRAPTSWFHFDGPWGDELYSLGDDRQWRLFGQYHYVTGPMGPKFKHLGREKVCQTERCRILYSIAEGRKSSWHN